MPDSNYDDYNIDSTTDQLMKILKSADSLDSFLERAESKQPSITLSEYFEYLFEQKQCKKPDIIRKALLDTYYAYQIFRGERKPSRDKLIQLALAFPLTEKETQLLLYLGGVQNLYIKNRRDSIILYALNKHLTIEQVSELLQDKRETPLV